MCRCSQWRGVHTTQMWTVVQNDGLNHLGHVAKQGDGGGGVGPAAGRRGGREGENRVVGECAGAGNGGGGVGPATAKDPKTEESVAAKIILRLQPELIKAI